MTDRIPNIEWMATHIAGPISEPLAAVKAWSHEHACEGGGCSRCGRPMKESNSVCLVPGEDIYVFCPNCRDSFKASGFLEIPNLLWLEILLLRGTV